MAKCQVCNIVEVPGVDICDGCMDAADANHAAMEAVDTAIEWGIHTPLDFISAVVAELNADFGVQFEDIHPLSPRSATVISRISGRMYSLTVNLED